MRMARPIISFILLFSVFLLARSPLPSFADSCSCPKKQELEEAYAQSSAVFIGRVELQEDTVLRPEYQQVRIVVLRKFKWPEELTSQSLVLYTAKEEAKCGYKFQNGFDYLIFATGTPAFLRVDECSRTEVLEKAQGDQLKLQRGKK